MKRNLPILFAIVVVVALPFLFERDREVVSSPDDTVVIVSPHPESIRQEFARAFRRWYRERTGRTVYVDFRTPGGTSSIITYLDSEYTNNFRNHWVDALGRSWSMEVQNSYADHRVSLPDDPAADSLAQRARRAFLESEVGSGIDLFFGGGSFDFIRQTRKGQLVSSRFLTEHAGFFADYPDGIPRSYAGEPFYDAEGRWFGAVLSSFGIIFNRDALRRVGIERDLESWDDLGDPRLFRQVAVADPSHSGSMNKIFEIMIQNKMQGRYAQVREEAGGTVSAEAEHRARAEGWMDGMRLIQRIAANARYFTDSAPIPNIDVAIGDCAAGIAIDFYGRYQEETIRSRGGGDRFAYITPIGASAVSVDPIGLMRGAPNRDVAEAFIQFVMSPEGQALWNFEVGTAVSVPADRNPYGEEVTLRGPATFPLRRPPILPLLYDAAFEEYRSDPDVNPYREVAGFDYRPEWTSHLFNEQRFLIRVIFIDILSELRAAMAAIIAARSEGRTAEADRAYAVLSDLSRVSYENVGTRIKEVLTLRSAIEEVRLARELSGHFREQYREAERIARGSRRGGTGRGE